MKTDLSHYADEFFILGIVFLFLFINFDQDVGGIYSYMSILLILGYMIIKQSNVFMYPIERPGNSRVDTVMWAVVAFVIFNFISGTIISQSAIKFLGSLFASSPVLQKSPTLVFATWGWLIPVIETVLFLLLFFLFAAKLFKNINWNNPLSTGIVLSGVLVSVIFALYHLQVRQVTNNPELIVTFVFMAISIALVVIRKQMIEAILIHIIANSLAIINVLNISFATIGAEGLGKFLPTIVTIIALTWFLFVRKLKLPSRRRTRA